MNRKNAIPQYIDLIRNEAELHSKLKHVNIIDLKEYDLEAVQTRRCGKERKVFFLGLELARGGEMFQYIAQTGPFPE